MEVSTEYDPDVVFYKNAIFSAFCSKFSLQVRLGIH